MAVPGQRAPSGATATLTHGAKGPALQPAQTTSPAAPNVPQTSYVLSADAVPFSLPAGGGSVDVTFPNMPVRRGVTNPLTPLGTSQAPYSPLATDTLILMAMAQGESAPVVAQVFAIEKSGARAPGPFLQGGNTYTAFGATISGTAAATGTVVGLLVLMVG